MQKTLMRPVTMNVPQQKSTKSFASTGIHFSSGEKCTSSSRTHLLINAQNNSSTEIAAKKGLARGPQPLPKV